MTWGHHGHYYYYDCYCYYLPGEPQWAKHFSNQWSKPLSVRLKCKPCRPIGWALWQIANRSICKSLTLYRIDTSQSIHHALSWDLANWHVMWWHKSAKCNSATANCKCRDTVTWQLQNSWFYGIFMFTLSRKCMTNAWAANLPHIMQHDTGRKSLSCILHEPTKLYGSK